MPLVLLSLDRLPGKELVTQELIANMLGVRREGVTEAAGKLQTAGLIHYSRGKISVLDRPKLEQRVCECYGVVKKSSTACSPINSPLDPKLLISDSVPDLRLIGVRARCEWGLYPAALCSPEY
jgi:hypothetical protein